MADGTLASLRDKAARYGYDAGRVDGAYYAFALADTPPRILSAPVPELLDAEIGTDWADRGGRP